jgi:uncharacterized protein (TIGR03437 family)
VFGLLKQPSPTAIVNAASLTAGPVAPGSLISIFGSNLATATELASTTWLPHSLAGVTLSINRVVAPLLFVSPNQINAQVPFGVPVGPSVATLHVSAAPDVSIQFSLASAAPGIFVDGASQARARNADGSINTPGNPAAAGSRVSVFVTGLGAVDPSVEDGVPAPANVAVRAVHPVTAKIGQSDSAVIFAGLSAESVGVYRVDLVVPRTNGGLYPVVITVNGIDSNAGWISTTAYPQ